MGGYTRDLKRVLKQAGCHYVRPGKGDHEIWFSPITGISFPVDANIKSRHTANTVLKQAGVDVKF